MGVFETPSPRLFTIPAGADFLNELASVLITECKIADDPGGLSDGIIYVPNRRSARMLSLALYKAANRSGFLMPEIRPLGDLDADDPLMASEAAIAQLGPAPSEPKRLGQLARLVSAWYETRKQPISPTAAVAAAGDLSRLLDQAALAGEVDWTHLKTLVQDSDLAEHWQQSVDFLDIIANAWPTILRESGEVEAYDRRVKVAEALAERWATSPPKGPIIIAGSTGTTPAARLLMQAAAGLDNGAVVFPGLDRDITPEQWAEISATPSHPQFAFRDTLVAFERTPQSVPEWPGIAATPDLDARRRLLNAALAPAPATADWLGRLDDICGNDSREQFISRALSGFSLIETNDEADEARVCALIMREALETPGQTTALVTAEPVLARRVSALLARWGVDVVPSAGEPLLRTGAGSFAGLVLSWLLDPSDPVRLAALVKHPMTRFGRPRGALLSDWAKLERHMLRGARRWQSLDGLRARTENAVADKHGPPECVLPLIDDIISRAAGAAVFEGMEAVSGRVAAETLAAAMGEVAETEDGDRLLPWSGRDGSQVGKFLEAFAETCDWLAPIPTGALVTFFEGQASQIRIPSDRPGHPRLSIWGPLEARLQSCDRIIVAGLNEGQWPEPAPSDGFLPRHFRKQLGLPDPDTRIGLSAHDFAQLACAPDVVAVRSKRVEDEPAVASRWIWRLKVLVGGALDEAGRDAALAFEGSFDPSLLSDAWVTAESGPMLPPPRPKPPADMRPKRLSVTQITTLIRDPYAIYARNVLGLESLDPLGGSVGPSDIGSAVHKAIEICTKANRITHADLTEEMMVQLRKIGFTDHDLAKEAPRLRQAADEFDRWWTARGDQRLKPEAELRGKVELEIGPSGFKLTGQADLVEIHDGQAVALFDYKTGSPPTKPQVNSGLEPQLPLLGAMVQRGGFEGLGEASVAALGYLKVRGGVTETMIASGSDADDLSSESFTKFETLLVTMMADDTPYLSKPRAKFAATYETYDRLARRDEWSSPVGDES